MSLVQPVIRSEDADLVRAETAGLNVLPPVFGGATRQASVRAGLEALFRVSPTSCSFMMRRALSPAQI